MNIFDQAVAQLRQRQQLLAILVFSLVAIIVWITISLVTSQRSTAISPQLRRMAEPLTPTINAQIIQQVEQENYLSDQQLQNFPVFRVIEGEQRRETLPPSPSPASSASPSASPVLPSPSPSPTLNPSPVSTSSGTL